MPDAAIQCQIVIVRRELEVLDRMLGAFGAALAPI
jgi:hypothetical protein